jgi:demethoxyubiquinone hydroxylase (CLK1/Coq7/Cat5 family)
MECVVEKEEVVSRHYLEQLQIKLERVGDDRLARALADCDILRFAIQWTSCLAAAVLLVMFVRSALLAQVWHCLAMVLGGALLGSILRAVDRQLLRHYHRRFYEAVPEDLRWCFRRTP